MLENVLHDSCGVKDLKGVFVCFGFVNGSG